MNILLGVTGSVAAIKFEKLHDALSEIGTVKSVFTQSALRFVDIKPLSIKYSLDNKCDIYTDDDEWNWHKLGDPVLHVELADWANILVVAPLSANTLAKFANGICDNLLTCIYRALHFSKLVVVAPAMNTNMWSNNMTFHHKTQFLSDNINRRIIYPIEKKLACGSVGVGAMADVSTIAERIRSYVKP
jgi:phosphopantothenoylcysteine decarboxylase